MHPFVLKVAQVVVVVLKEKESEKHLHILPINELHIYWQNLLLSFDIQQKSKSFRLWELVMIIMYSWMKFISQLW